MKSSAANVVAVVEISLIRFVAIIFYYNKCLRCVVEHKKVTCLIDDLISQIVNPVILDVSWNMIQERERVTWQVKFEGKLHVN